MVLGGGGLRILHPLQTRKATLLSLMYSQWFLSVHITLSHLSDIFFVIGMFIQNVSNSCLLHLITCVNSFKAALDLELDFSFYWATDGLGGSGEQLTCGICFVYHLTNIYIYCIFYRLRVTLKLWSDSKCIYFWNFTIGVVLAVSHICGVTMFAEIKVGQASSHSNALTQWPLCAMRELTQPSTLYPAASVLVVTSLCGLKGWGCDQWQKTFLACTEP